MNEPGPCVVRTERDGKIKILSCPETALVSREILEGHIVIINASIDLKNAKGRHHSEIAAKALFSLLP
jgi:hypothetical protein